MWPIYLKIIGGSSYFLTFIDDESRKILIYILKSKDQIFEVFKDFYAKVEREIGKFLKCIHTDNGREYTSKIFDNYCSKYGVRYKKSIPYTTSNGIAKKKSYNCKENYEYAIFS